ncbi:Complex i intermediate-associated protein mitochondrial [Fasciolopsis buskii]|uniref:Complex i intermediate-associated protein mitochondrial n=1 Tax=Fasciolopsis buskii TaxID=27845 RepID=A0A8E0VEG3_9TREM|nr:Complex i intermediate-associated protein mitochondrial [Fasciolopsis buski]
MTDKQFAGYGLFRGFLSTRVPERGDLVRSGFVNLRSPESTMFGLLMPYVFQPYTHLIIRYRGDGRSYRINLLPRQQSDIAWFDMHHFVLYTRGGPYWQIAKIPLSKFFVLRRGLIRLSQEPLNGMNVRLLSFSLMDQIDGPFSLELDYIALYVDPDHKEKFAYEVYDRTGTMH